MLYQDLTTLRTEQQRQYDEIMHALSPTHDHAEASRRVLSEMERMVKEIKNDVESKDYREHLNQLHEIVKEGHATLASSSRSLSCYLCLSQRLIELSQLSTAAGVTVSSSSSLLRRRSACSSATLYIDGGLIRSRRSTCDHELNLVWVLFGRRFGKDGH